MDAIVFMPLSSPSSKSISILSRVPSLAARTAPSSWSSPIVSSPPSGGATIASSSSTVVLLRGCKIPSRRRKWKFCAAEHATADLSPPLHAQPALAAWLAAFYRFTRPHTVIGTAIGIVSISLLAAEGMSDVTSPRFVLGLLQALFPALLMNVYIVGLNQISDIEIDKVNKPYLPLASGEFSLGTGIALVIASALSSLGVGFLVKSRPLLWALTVSFALGTAYSVELPFLRWKRSAVAAASCILSVRAIVVQLAFFLHMQVFVLKRPAIFPRSLIFATAFMCFFSIVIALFKDIPDVEGDRTYGIQSFSVRLGQEKVFWLCIGLLEAAYASAVIFGAMSTTLWSKIAMTVGHCAIAAALWIRSQTLDMSSKTAISSFYMFVWKLFYAEYLLIPLMR